MQCVYSTVQRYAKRPSAPYGTGVRGVVYISSYSFGLLHPYLTGRFYKPRLTLRARSGRWCTLSAYVAQCARAHHGAHTKRAAPRVAPEEVSRP